MKRMITGTILAMTMGVLCTSPLAALTGDEALSRFKSRMYSIPKMTGIISWRTNTGSTYTGSFKYMAPGKIYVKFSSPGGKTIVSNGRKLWTYDSSSNICGIQELGRDSSGGISSVVSGYMAIVTSQGSNGYTLKLKNSDRVYSEIILFLDKSFMLRKAILKREDGEGFSITLSDVDTQASVMNSMFNFNVPANAQVVNNPLNIR